MLKAETILNQNMWPLPVAQVPHVGILCINCQCVCTLQGLPATVAAMRSCSETVSIMLTWRGSGLRTLLVANKDPPVVKLDGLHEADAVELFKQELRRGQNQQLQLEQAELVQLARLCQCNPLMLQFVAASIRRGRCTVQVRLNTIGTAWPVTNPMQ